MKNYILSFALVLLSVVFVGSVTAQNNESIGVKDGGVLIKGWTGEIESPFIEI